MSSCYHLWTFWTSVLTCRFHFWRPWSGHRPSRRPLNGGTVVYTDPEVSSRNDFNKEMTNLFGSVTKFWSRKPNQAVKYGLQFRKLKYDKVIAAFKAASKPLRHSACASLLMTPLADNEQLMLLSIRHESKYNRIRTTPPASLATEVTHKLTLLSITDLY